MMKVTRYQDRNKKNRTVGFCLIGGGSIGPAESAHGDRVVVLRAIAPIIDGSFSIGVSFEPGKFYHTVRPRKKPLGCAIKISDERCGDGLGKRMAGGGYTRNRSPERIPVIGGQGICPAGCPHPVVAAIEGDS